jgi:hypothetical protein
LPDLIVTAREIRYDKKALKRGERFTATEKDAKVLKLLKKVEDAPAFKPVRKVAETKAPEPKPIEAAVEAAPVEAAPVEVEAPKTATRALTTDDMPEATPGRYRNRALKSED